MQNTRQVAGRICLNPLRIYQSTSRTLWLSSPRFYSSDIDHATSSTKDQSSASTTKTTEEAKPKKKTQAELDQELLLKLQGLAGDGGDSGVEYEDGKPVSMKRSVKNNMFRYI
ncbi:hypothetical protein P153DRAFT_394741 [Dothidotthia symphoricarpi CBS 119687]|uniref:Uncharacterized protein n=1 Tax=Dothidotthia symphoricarpi CBS 119687 TaxID=1392245 RepID=A0A6A6AHH2_9PLEO|nr:uncharacterized protein P153DRAFT_394741 [Dothidotthia symphoricarpi CBS 119687]KAF2131399.1 hypothetical protein P153DRAFT_394741 [Dothidotthia symphoricarpi CBS 119687]